MGIGYYLNSRNAAESHKSWRLESFSATIGATKSVTNGAPMASQSAGYQLTKRKKKGRELGPWQVRVFVPKAMQARVGRKEIWRSLETADRRLAERRAVAKVVEIESEWEPAAQLGSSTVDLDPATIAVRIGYDDMLNAMEQRRRDWPADDAGYAARLTEREAALRRYARKLQDGDTATWEALADRAIASRDLPIAKGSDAYTGFVQAIAEGTIDAIAVFTRRASGELDAAPRSPIVREAKAKQAAKAKLGETLLELFEQWSEEALAKGSKRLDTVNQDRKVVQRFAAFVGPDRAIDAITPQDVCDYRDTMRKLPPKWMSKRELRHLDMRAAAEKARALNLPRTAFTNVNKHLSTISPLYTWLGKMPKWAGLRNPVDGLFYDDVKGKNRRPSFSTADLNKIVSSPLFTGFKADGEEHLVGNVHADDWRRWIPLVAMFTGARIGEVAQLRIGDVCQERGVWFVHIRHDEGEGLATKSGECRHAAVHPMLDQIGFLTFHARQRERARGDLAAPLFPELEPNSRGQISGEPSRWWRDYLEAIEVKHGGDGFGAHSFRHTLADRLRSEAELLDNQIAVCLGHSLKSTTGGYGELPQGTVTMLKGWMDAVRFDGVSFDHLVPA